MASLLAPLLVVLWAVSAQGQKDVCYEPYGCFSVKKPFLNTPEVPEDPRDLEVSFFLSTRATNGSRRLTMETEMEKVNKFFMSNAPVRVIVHDYRESAKRPWITEMTDRLLDRADENVLVVHWQKAASTYNYYQAVANTRVIGAMLAAMLNKFVEQGSDPATFHLIGFGLGAHICGYAGEALKGSIGRITGLDPSGPCFENTPTPVRLDDGDAKFVDVIHSSTVPSSRGSYGYITPCGTADFYPNGGSNQPGCYGSMACNHFRAVALFMESISNVCPILSRGTTYSRALSRPLVVKKACKKCVTLGYELHDAKGLFSLTTRDRQPYCL